MSDLNARHVLKGCGMCRAIVAPHTLTNYYSGRSIEIMTNYTVSVYSCSNAYKSLEEQCSKIRSECMELRHECANMMQDPDNYFTRICLMSELVDVVTACATLFEQIGVTHDELSAASFDVLARNIRKNRM